MTAFNTIQKIAYAWYRMFDSSGFIFKLLAGQHFIVRFFIYILLPISFYFIMAGAGTAISKYSPQYAEGYFEVFGTALLYSGTFFTALLSTYESIIYIDSSKIQKSFLRKQNTQKQEQWRLRNMHYLVRALIYASLWFFDVLIIYIVIIGFVIDNMPLPHILDKESELHFHSQAEYESFIAAVNNLFTTCSAIFTLIVLAAVIFLEWRLKKIKKVS